MGRGRGKDREGEGVKLWSKAGRRSRAMWLGASSGSSPKRPSGLTHRPAERASSQRGPGCRVGLWEGRCCSLKCFSTCRTTDLIHPSTLAFVKYYTKTIYIGDGDGKARVYS